jgi:hypothetical protein
MDGRLTIILMLVVSICAMYLQYLRYIIFIKNDIRPFFKSHNYAIQKIKKVEWLHFIEEDRGDFNGEARMLFGDTQFNRKLYFYLYYLDECK